MVFKMAISLNFQKLAFWHPVVLAPVLSGLVAGDSAICGRLAALIL